MKVRYIFIFLFIFILFSSSLYAENNMKLLLDLAEFYAKNAQYDKAIEIINYVLVNDPYNNRASSMLEINRKLYLKNVSIEQKKKSLKIISKFNETKKEIVTKKKEVKTKKNISNDITTSLEGVATKAYLSKISFSMQLKLKKYLDRGIEYSSENRYSDAIIEFKKIISLRSDYPDAYYQMGLCYFNLKKYNKAIEYFNKALKIIPNSGKVYFWLGYTKYNLGKVKDSITDYTKSIELNSSNIYVYLYIGNSYKFLNNYKKALEYYKKCWESDNSNLESFGLMTLMMLELGELKEGFKNSKILFQKNKDNKYAYSTMAIYFYLKKEYKRSSDIIKKGLKIDPNDWYLLRTSVLLRCKTDLLEGIVDSFNKTIIQFPNDIELYIAVIKLYIKFGKYTEAMNLAKKGEASTGEHAKIHYYMGLIHEKLSEFDEAMLEYEFVLKRTPDDLKLRENLAKVYTASEYYKDAIIQYEYILEKDEKNSKATFYRDEIDRLKSLIEESIKEEEQSDDSSDNGLSF